MYTQVRLIKQTENGCLEQFCWIPTKFAKLNKVLQIKENNRWINGWTVKFVGETTDNPVDISKSIRLHRRNTGDSLTKRPSDECSGICSGKM